MKLINLNIWTGKIYDELIKFISEQKSSTDIFCFQEVSSFKENKLIHETRTDMLTVLSNLLPEFYCHFEYIGSGYDLKGKVDFPLRIGQATFVRKTIKKIDEGSVFVYRSQGQMGPPYPDGRGDFPRNFLFDELETDGKRFLILNLHGFWEPAVKYDTPQRFQQSEMILDFIAKRNFPTVLAGDFNLSINTQSILMLENKLSNLVKDFKLITTRSSLYNPYYRIHDEFADYVFVSSDITVNDFKALPAQVSDHLPLYLKFEV